MGSGLGGRLMAKIRVLNKDLPDMGVFKDVLVGDCVYKMSQFVPELIGTVITTDHNRIHVRHFQYNNYVTIYTKDLFYLNDKIQYLNL